MASARSRLGAARRSLIKRQKKTDLLSGILGTAGTLAAFAGTQAKKAKTAWGEYEAGYKALPGGKDQGAIKEGGWLARTFGRPKGEVTVGEKIYDREKIRKAGAFLGGDIGATLSEGARESYLQKTAPGRWAPESFDKPATGPHMVALDMDTTRLETSWKDDLFSQYEGKEVDLGFQIPEVKTGPSVGIKGTGLSAKEWVQKQMAEKAWDWEKGGRQIPADIQPSPITKEYSSLREEYDPKKIPEAIPGSQIPKQYLPTYGMSSEEREIYDTSWQEKMNIGTDRYRKQWENISDEEWEQSQRFTGRYK